MILGSGLLLAARGDQHHACCADTASLCHLTSGPGKDPQPSGFTQRRSAETIHPAGWREQGTSRITKHGLCKVPRAPLLSSGCLCSLALSDHRDPSTAGCSPVLWYLAVPHQCLCKMLVGCWWLLAERWQQIVDATSPALLPLACQGTAGRQRTAPQSPARSRQSSPGSSPWGQLLLESNRAGSAAPPVSKGLTSNFLC